MFDVPLNDTSPYVGPTLEDANGALTSATGYVKAASKPSKNSSQNETYSFDV